LAGGGKRWRLGVGQRREDWERGKAHRRIKNPQAADSAKTTSRRLQAGLENRGAKREELKTQGRGPKTETEPNGKWNGIESKRS